LDGYFYGRPTTLPPSGYSVLLLMSWCFFFSPPILGGRLADRRYTCSMVTTYMPKIHYTRNFLADGEVASLCVLSRYEMFFVSSDNQFGFKRGLT